MKPESQWFAHVLVGAEIADIDSRKWCGCASSHSYEICETVVWPGKVNKSMIESVTWPGKANVRARFQFGVYEERNLVPTKV